MKALSMKTKLFISGAIRLQGDDVVLQSWSAWSSTATNNLLAMPADLARNVLPAMTLLETHIETMIEDPLLSAADAAGLENDLLLAHELAEDLQDVVKENVYA